MTRNNINPSIFREYDIRGRIDKPDELSPENSYLLGRATGVFFDRRNIKSAVVGHDARSYSTKIKDDFARGLQESGIDVYEIGQVLSPIFYFSQYNLKQKGGAMITASHNPDGWSGLKIANDYSTTLLPQEVQELYQIFIKGEFKSGKGERKISEDIVSEYTKDVLSRVSLKKKFKVVADTGNGGAGIIVPDILRRAGCEVVERHCELDTTFPNHIPNPSNLETARDLARGVKEEGADLGFGFDDDGDRLGFSDEEGNVVWPDKALIILMRSILKKYPGSSVVFDVKATKALIEDIKARGGVPVMSKTGHSYIKQKAKDVDAALAGERSGHIFFRKDYYGFDDAIYAALKFLEALEKDGRPFSKILKELPQYITSPSWEPECADDKKYGVVGKITEQFKKEYGEENVIDINGARVTFEDGWGLIRASSNLPRLVMIFESKTEEGLKRIEKIFREKLGQFPEVGKEWESG